MNLPSPSHWECSHDRSHKNGFTLIEILVVIVIISIVAGMAVLTISTNPYKQIENTATALKNTILVAEEEAILHPLTIGLALSAIGYQFYEYADPESDHPWRPLTNPIFGFHKFANTIQPTLLMKDKTILLKSEPQIFIFDSGELSPFIILLAKKGEHPHYQITGNANGEIINEVVND